MRTADNEETKELVACIQKAIAAAEREEELAAHQSKVSTRLETTKLWGAQVVPENSDGNHGHE